MSQHLESLLGAQRRAECAKNDAAAAETPLHSVKREGGCGIDEALTPVCTCGWRGSAVEGWRDDQFIQLVAQEVQHRNGPEQQVHGFRTRGWM